MCVNVYNIHVHTYICTYIYEQIGLKMRTQSFVDRKWEANLGGRVERAQFSQNTSHEIFKD